MEFYAAAEKNVYFKHSVLLALTYLHWLLLDVISIQQLKRTPLGCIQISILQLAHARINDLNAQPINDSTKHQFTTKRPVICLSTGNQESTNNIVSKLMIWTIFFIFFPFSANHHFETEKRKKIYCDCFQLRCSNAGMIKVIKLSY